MTERKEKGKKRETTEAQAKEGRAKGEYPKARRGMMMRPKRKEEKRKPKRHKHERKMRSTNERRKLEARRERREIK